MKTTTSSNLHPSQLPEEELPVRALLILIPLNAYFFVIDTAKAVIKRLRP